MKDQQQMIHKLEDLITQCQEDQVAEQTRGAEDASGQEDRRLRNGRRLVQASLRAFFPNKSKAQVEALRQALDSTIEELGRRLVLGRCFAANDFLSSTDSGRKGTEAAQSPLAKEIRRQHRQEVFDMIAELTSGSGNSKEANKANSPAIDMEMTNGRPVGTSLDHKQLWVAATSKDVADQLMVLDSLKKAEMESRSCSGTSSPKAETQERELSGTLAKGNWQKAVANCRVKERRNSRRRSLSGVGELMTGTVEEDEEVRSNRSRTNLTFQEQSSTRTDRSRRSASSNVTVPKVPPMVARFSTSPDGCR